MRKIKTQAAQDIEMLEIGEIKPYERNPRLNESAVKFVANSIKQFGFKVPIIIDADGVIVCGHTRWKAAQKLKIASVPCIRASDLTPEQIKAFRIADNKVGEMAQWDSALLAAEIGETPEFNFADFGFNTEEMRGLAEQVGNGAESGEDSGEGTRVDKLAQEADEQPQRIHRGEIWRVGAHTLMCGDSTSKEDVSALVEAAGQEVALLLTDPPYNVAYKGGTEEELTIANDDMGDGAFEDFLTRAFQAADSVMIEGAPFYIWHALWTRAQFDKAMRAANFHERQYLIWVKSSFTLGRQDYQWRHEPCYYGWKDGAGHYFNASRAISTVIDDIRACDIDALDKEQARAILKRIAALPSTVMKCDKQVKSEIHPTMKPVELFMQQVQNSSRYGDLVLDIFGGSGTTAVACQRLGRASAMMELDEKYANRILYRLEKDCGSEAEKVN